MAQTGDGLDRPSRGFYTPAMPRITIVTVNWYSGCYLADLVAHLCAKAHDPQALAFLVMDNTAGRDGDLRELTAVRAQVHVEPLDTAGRTGSRAHAMALNRAMGLLATEYCLVVDPDVHVFEPQWDRFCLEELDQHGAAAIGAPYPPWKVGKYHDFPSPPFCLFNVEALRPTGLDWTPFCRGPLGDMGTFALRQVGRLGPIVTRRRYERSCWCRRWAAWAERRLGVFSRDTGWRIAREARRQGLRSVLFETVVAPGHGIAVSGTPRERALAALAGQYELFAWAGRPIVAHKYGSAGWPWRTELGDDLEHWQRCIAMVEAGEAMGDPAEER